jgi:hypothetical protein
MSFPRVYDHSRGHAYLEFFAQNMIASVLDVGKAISSIGIFLAICCPDTHRLEPVEVKLYPRCAPGQTMPLFLEIGSLGR